MLDVIFVLGHRAEPAFAAATLALISRDRRAFDVAVLRDRNRDFFVGDQIFDRIVGAGFGDFGAARIAKFFLNVFEFFDDDPAQRFFVAENLFKFGDQFDNRFVLFDDLLTFEP